MDSTFLLIIMDPSLWRRAIFRADNFKHMKKIKAERREKKRQSKNKMKVSGASVKNIQKIKIDKAGLTEKYWSK